jgi:hypothetical protein
MTMMSTRVVDDLGSLGRVWREADYGTTDWENVIADLLAGEYKNPIRVITLNSAGPGHVR